MGEAKTRRTDDDVEAFLASISDERQREDSRFLVEMMSEVSGAEPVMWGSTIIGFGHSQITYANGTTQPWFSVGFSPRKGKLSLYIVDDAAGHESTLERLGKYSHGKACIWVKRLSDVDTDVLRELVEESVARDRP